MQVTALGPDEPSPFRLGSLDKGANASILETGGTIQAVAAHDQQPHRSCFVLARKSTGQLFLRKLTGTFTVRLLQSAAPAGVRAGGGAACDHEGASSNRAPGRAHCHHRALAGALQAGARCTNACRPARAAPATHKLHPVTRSSCALQAGQQQPKVAVVAPGSAAMRDVEDSRAVAWVQRTLRREQTQAARGTGTAPSEARALAAEGRPTVSKKARGHCLRGVTLLA